MSTPKKPDEPGPAASSAAADAPGGTRTGTDEAAGGQDATTRVSTVADREPADGAATAGSDQADAPSESSGGGSAGPPPPWQRGGAGAGAPSAPVPAGGRPGPRPNSPPTPAGGQPRVGGGPGGPGGNHPPSGPFARPGGPQGGPQGPGVQQGSNPPSGGIPVASRTAPVSGAARPGGTGDGGGASGSTGTSSSGIDAPTNQLSPDQLGLRPREDADEGRREPDDVADLATARPRTGKAPRRASLQVRRFDPWSVLKLALVLGVALFFVWMFAVGVLYAVLDGMGVWAQLNGTYQDLTSDAGGGGELITAGGVFGVAAVIGVVNIILFTALASVSAFIYNISADVAGGIEVTLSERE
ncbi:DUF3566 domain-containing protein [Actinomycetospora sp. CA-101289]|uniref:DUF3566 domain-containing protein n=1 Tax=Actinomycetospora sp. CA-101289 TaxID=3239893 RepID=UPI003D96308A